VVPIGTAARSGGEQGQRIVGPPAAAGGSGGGAPNAGYDQPVARPRGTSSAQLSNPGWEPPRDLDQREWLEVGRTLGRIGRYSRWWVGDWLIYADRKWGEMYNDASKVTGYDYGTLRNIVSIAQRFPLSRRRDNLSWGHHADVASLPPDEQDYWLDHATELGLSRADLRIELRAALRSGPGRSERDEREPAECPEHSVRCTNCGSEVAIPADVAKAIRAAEAASVA
jgi:hypothetical protein